MSKPSRNQIYEAVIHRMVVQSLAEEEKKFGEEHSPDSDEMLLDYLKQSAKQLQHTPWPKEIVGWQLILERFGTWQEAVQKAGLPPMSTPNTPTKFQLYRLEEEIQKQKHRAKRAEKKAKSLQRDKERKLKTTVYVHYKSKSSETQTPPDTDGENL